MSIDPQVMDVTSHIYQKGSNMRSFLLRACLCAAVCLLGVLCGLPRGRAELLQQCMSLGCGSLPTSYNAQCFPNLDVTHNCDFSGNKKVSYWTCKASMTTSCAWDTNDPPITCWGVCVYNNAYSCPAYMTLCVH
jgi:hypothetical protein